MFVVFNPFALNVVVAVAVIIAITGGAVEAQMSGWTEMYIPYNNYVDENGNTVITEEAATEKFPFEVGEEIRQHLHVMQYPSDEPTPVYFSAHGNGGKAENNINLDIFAEAGYSVISWESVTKIELPLEGITCLADFELVWDWFQANAELYNFDKNKVIIGGRSRGSVCSWTLAHSGKPGISGVYMYNALPDTAWIDEVKFGEEYIYEIVVSSDSPPVYLTYGPECPKPIEQDCEPSPNKNDIHNPRHGQTIVDKYTELGMESKITVVDGLTNNVINPFGLFPDFIATLPDDCEDDETKEFNIAIPGGIQTKDCPWLASESTFKRKKYCKKNVKDNGGFKKLSEICKETCGLVGVGLCA